VPESDDWDTVGGFLATTLGRLPEPGDQVPVETGILRVDRVEAQRVSRVQFVPEDLPFEASHDATGGGAAVDGKGESNDE